MMKQRSRPLRAAALLLLLSLALSWAPPASAAGRVTAAAGNIDLFFNGKAMKLGTYNIANNNYVKLRDVAQLLSGTEKSISVTWNSDAFCIELVRGGIYQPAGGELAPLTGGNQSAVLNSAAVLLDGKDAALTAYNIGGSNFFKLRDLGSALDFYVGWDSSTGTVIVDTSKGYESTDTAAGPVTQIMMAKAMQEILDQADDEGYVNAYLVDLDKDGTKELIFFNDLYVHLYAWKDGKLQSTELGNLAGDPQYWLCADSASGEQGIEYQNRDEFEIRNTYHYFSHTTQISVQEHYDFDLDSISGEKTYAVNGKEAGQAEYEAVKTQNRRGMELEQWGEPLENLGAVSDELGKLMAAEPSRTDKNMSDEALLEVAAWAADEMFYESMTLWNGALVPTDQNDVITVVYNENGQGSSIVDGENESGMAYFRVIGCNNKSELEDALNREWHKNFARKYSVTQAAGDLYEHLYVEYNGAMYASDGTMGDGGGVIIVDKMLSRTADEAEFEVHFSRARENRFHISLVYEDGLWKFGYFDN